VDIVQKSSFVKSLAFALYSIIALVVVASYLLVLLMGYGFFFFTPGGMALSMRSYSFPVFILFIFWLGTPALRAGAVFSFIWIAYSVCFVFSWKWRWGFHNAFGKSSSTELRNIFKNFLFAMPLLSSMVLTAALAIVYSQSAVGVETGMVQLPSDLHEAFLELAYGPLREEPGFRLVPIGFLIVFYVFLLGRNIKAVSATGNRLKLFFMAFIYPEGAKRMAGLPNVSDHGVFKGISSAEWVMIVVTSAVFGSAHLLSPGGWEIGKITSAFVQGSFLAVTYIAYGFEAPILLHWYFNYYNYFFDPVVAEGFFPTTIGLLSVIEIMILILGIVGWAAFAVAGLRKFVGPKREQPLQPSLSLFTQP